MYDQIISDNISNCNLIIGMHSIQAALSNPKREFKYLFFTKESQAIFSKYSDKDNSIIKKYKVSSNDLNKYYANFCKELNFKVSRVPSSAFLLAQTLETNSLHNVWTESDKKPVKIIILDQVTDVHNAGAILRTASFFGFDFVIIPNKGSANLSPNFFRISSGAAEYVNLISSPSLSKAINKLQDKGVICAGFSEHANTSFNQLLNSNKNNNIEEKQKTNLTKSYCFIFGSEDTGLSNAVKSNLKNIVAIESLGDIKSLNVSVAVSVALSNFTHLSS